MNKQPKQSARQANRQWAQKSAQKRQNTKAGNTAAGRGPTCGKAHAQPPSGGTSLHPGAASQTGQIAAAKAPHTQAHGGQTASRPRQHRPDQAQKQQAARKPGTRQRSTGRKTPEHRAQKPPQQRPAAQERPARHMARHAGQKEPLRTGKIRSFACPEGPCEPGPPKNRFAVFGWHGLFLLRISDFAARSAEQRGRRPLLSPAAFWKRLAKTLI